MTESVEDRNNIEALWRYPMENPLNPFATDRLKDLCIVDGDKEFSVGHPMSVEFTRESSVLYRHDVHEVEPSLPLRIVAMEFIFQDDAHGLILPFAGDSKTLLFRFRTHGKGYIEFSATISDLSLNGYINQSPQTVLGLYIQSDIKFFGDTNDQ